MDCDRVRRLLNGYLDGELDLVTALDLEAHLQTCAACAGQYRQLMSLKTALGDKALYRPAPPHLEKQIRAALRKARPASPAGFVVAWRWFAPAALMAAVLLVLAGFLGRGLLIPQSGISLVQQVQMAHVRSLMADHLMDVASTDQHTVKPWFDGKLDFSPPVTDLAAQGFPLIGGRLDALDGRPVAALVYQRNKHVINVFVWPSTAQPAGVQRSADNGYHLIQWNQMGMTFWAISDVSAEDLGTFVQLFQNSIK
jgi:anti-sigma factor RsiW